MCLSKPNIPAPIAPPPPSAPPQSASGVEIGGTGRNGGNRKSQSGKDRLRGKKPSRRFTNANGGRLAARRWKGGRKTSVSGLLGIKRR